MDNSIVPEHFKYCTYEIGEVYVVEILKDTVQWLNNNYCSVKSALLADTTVFRKTAGRSLQLKIKASDNDGLVQTMHLGFISHKYSRVELEESDVANILELIQNN